MYSKFFFVILLLFFGLLGFAYSYHLPIAKAWLKSQIIAQTQDQSLQLIPSDIDFTFFPIGFHLKDLEIKPHKKMKSLSPFIIEKLSFIINFSSIFSGYFLLNEVRIKGMDMTLHLDGPSSASTHPKTTNAFLKKWNKDTILQYTDVPIASFVVEDTQLSVSHGKRVFSWNDLFFKANRKGERWSITINSPDLSYQDKASSQLKSHWTFKTRFNLEQDHLFVSNLSLSQDSNYFILSGYCSIARAFENCFKDYKIQVRSYFNMQTVQDVALFFYTDNPQQFSGTLEVSATLENSHKRYLHAVFKAYFKRLKIDRFYIGQVQLEGSFQNNVIFMPKASIQNRGNFVELNESKLSMDENLSLETQVQIKSLEIKRLLTDFQIGPPPLHLSVEGKLPCKGQFLPEVNIDCSSGHLNISDFAVYNDKEDHIVALDTAEARGRVQVTKDQVMVNSKLKIGDTQGQVSGYVNYKSGFYFDFATPKFHFSDLTSLADLNLEGQTTLKGFTRGDSKQAIVLMDLQTKNLWFEDYGVGDLATALKYESGVLSFQNIQGIFGQTEYKGHLEVHLNSSTLEAKIRSQTLQLTDLREIFKRKYHLPFDVYALGRGNVHVWGPLKFNELSYDVDVDIDRGVIATESFDKIFFHVNAKDGEFKTEKVELHKGPSRAFVSYGVGHPNGQIDVQVKGSDFYLEQSQTLKDLNFNIFGHNNFELSLKGYVLKPEFQMNGHIDGFRISETPVSTPYYQIKLASNGLYLEGFLEDKSLNLKTLIPLHQQSPFSLELEAKQWDFSPLFALFTKGDLVQEYETFVSGRFNVSSPSDWIWKADGSVQFDQIMMRRGKNYLYLKQPNQISFAEGKMNMKDFTLTGNNTQFTVEAKDSQKDNLQMSLHGRLIPI